MEQGPGPITGGQVVGIPNQPVNGAISAIAAHRTDSNILYVGTVGGGIWSTQNALWEVDGVDNDTDGLIDAADPSERPLWTSLTDQFPSLSITTLAFDPADGNNMTPWAGTGRASSSSLGGRTIGLLKTTDGGQTWKVFPSVFNLLTGSDAVNDRFELKRDTDSPWMLNVFEQGSLRDSVPLSSIESITITTLAGDDDVILDFTNGPIAVPGGITIDAGAGNADDLMLKGRRRVLALPPSTTQASKPTL